MTTNTREDYLEAARRLFPGTSVEPHANVQPMADGSGAFVECIVWVPHEEVDPEAKATSQRADAEAIYANFVDTL